MQPVKHAQMKNDQGQQIFVRADGCRLKVQQLKNAAALIGLCFIVHLPRLS